MPDDKKKKKLPQAFFPQSVQRPTVIESALAKSLQKKEPEVPKPTPPTIEQKTKQFAEADKTRPQITETPKSDKPRILRDEKTGVVTGVELPDGKTFFGLTPDDVKNIVDRWTGRFETPKGAVELGEQQKAEDVSPEELAAFSQEVEDIGASLPPSVTAEQFAQEGGFTDFETRGERAIERFAEFGLQVPTLINNFSADLFGKDFNKTTAAEWARSTEGKITGSAFGAAMGGVLALGAGAALTGLLGGAVSSLASAMGVSKGAVVAAGGFGAAAVSGLSVDVVVDKILNRKDAGEIASSISDLVTKKQEILDLTTNGAISPSAAIAEINRIENDLLITEYKIKQAAILDPAVRQSGEYEAIRIEIETGRDELRAARSEILVAVPQFNPTEISLILDRMQAELEGKRKGALRE